jgi:guanosine-3',5'-bis(diphosphate) 3'-pyrophosphohydrolase
MTPLNRAIILAVEAHAGQTDKAGDPYILHPLRVMLRFTDPTERIVAVLHDVIKDGHYRLSDLAEMGFTQEIISALDALTRRPGEHRFRYLERLSLNQAATQVRLADLADNMDPERKSYASESLYARYQRAIKYLKRVFL